MHLPAWRFGKPYESLERDTLVHFLTGEPVAEVSQVGGAIVGRDLQKAAQARKALLAIDPKDSPVNGTSAPVFRLMSDS